MSHQLSSLLLWVSDQRLAGELVLALVRAQLRRELVVIERPGVVG